MRKGSRLTPTLLAYLVLTGVHVVAAFHGASEVFAAMCDGVTAGAYAVLSWWHRQPTHETDSAVTGGAPPRPDPHPYASAPSMVRINVPPSLHRALDERARREGASVDTVAALLLAHGLGARTLEA